MGVPAVKFNYSYDAVGNLIAVNDSINGISAAITGYTYDLLNRVTRLNQSGTGVQTKRVDMAYNAVNQLTSLSRYSGNNSVVDTNYVYDNNQRLIKLAHVKGASTIASYDYSYDAADKLASTVSSVDGTSNYSYDATNQLTGTDNTSQADEAYSYDANGNRTYGGYVTGVNNQLLSDGTYNYLYDGEGNRTKRTEIITGKVTEYVWDYRNRLASVLFKDAGGVVTKTIEYLYDGANQRIGKRIDGAVTERYVIDRNQIALVFDGAAVQIHRYLYGTQIDQILADETSTGIVWALGDNQGTVKDLIDDGGNLIEHLTYDSFGKLIGTPTTGFRYGYTGREQDGETGLDYYRARYYDSANGRFISEDPIGFRAGDRNLTRYVGNNPTNFIDPSGLYGKVTSYARHILYSETGDPIDDGRITTTYPLGFPYIGFGKPVQVRYGSPPRNSVNPPTLRRVNADPTKGDLPIRKGDQIVTDATIADIEYSDIYAPAGTKDPWGTLYASGRDEGDQRGHIIPRLLGGSNQRYNFFSQSRRMNGGGYNQFGIALNNYLTKLENKRKTCDGKEVPKLRLNVDLEHFYGTREKDRNTTRIHELYPLRPNRLKVLAKFSDGTVTNGWFSNKVNTQSNFGSDYWFKPLP